MVLCLNQILAQDYSNLEKVQLKGNEDYAKNEVLVLECSGYLLNSPLEALDSDINRLRALQFIMRWMEGTPDYMFGLDESISKVINSESKLLGIYMACMTKFVLENKEKSSDQKEIKYNSFLTLIAYCEDQDKGVKLNKELKKLIKARNDGTLREYLNC